MPARKEAAPPSGGQVAPAATPRKGGRAVAQTPQPDRTNHSPLVSARVPQTTVKAARPPKTPKAAVRESQPKKTEASNQRFDRAHPPSPAKTRLTSDMAQRVQALAQEVASALVHRSSSSGRSTSSAYVSGGSCMRPTVLKTGFESTALYLTMNDDGGASLTTTDADLLGSASVMDQELTQVMKKSVITPAFESQPAAPPLKPRKTKTVESNTAGPKWFNMPAPDVTPELKRDLQLLKLRNVLDPKRFYKKEGDRKLPKFFQVGTVVESSADFYAARVPKRDRKATIVDELLADDKSRKYYKRKFLEVQERQRQAPRRKKRTKAGKA